MSLNWRGKLLELVQSPSCTVAQKRWLKRHPILENSSSPGFHRAAYHFQCGHVFRRVMSFACGFASHVYWGSRARVAGLPKARPPAFIKPRGSSSPERCRGRTPRAHSGALPVRAQNERMWDGCVPFLPHTPSHFSPFLLFPGKRRDSRATEGDTLSVGKKMFDRDGKPPKFSGRLYWKLSSFLSQVVR